MYLNHSRLLQYLKFVKNVKWSLLVFNFYLLEIKLKVFWGVGIQSLEIIAPRKACRKKDSHWISNHIFYVNCIDYGGKIYNSMSIIYQNYETEVKRGLAAWVNPGKDHSKYDRERLKIKTTISFFLACKIFWYFLTFHLRSELRLLSKLRKCTNDWPFETICTH